MPVPLLAPDPDAALDLQETVTRAYDRGRYDTEIDYPAMTAPSWSPEEAAWIAERLGRTGPVN